jgi:hypothetical protein
MKDLTLNYEKIKHNLKAQIFSRLISTNFIVSNIINFLDNLSDEFKKLLIREIKI